MNLRKGQIVELLIEKMAFGGKGIGEYDGLKVFVKNTMPGDKIEAAFTRIKRNFAEAELVRILDKSRDRVVEKCRYASVCGGCQMQHIPYSTQLVIKKQHVVDCFERIAAIENPPVEDIVPCSERYFYRNKMDFSYGYDGEMDSALGLHLPGRRYDILDIEECHLQSDFSSRILNFSREFFTEKNWQPYKYSCGQGFVKSLCIRDAKRTGEVMINLVTSDDIPNNFDEDLENFVSGILKLTDEKFKITSVYWSKVISRRGQRKRIEEKLIYGKEFLTEEMKLDSGDLLKFDIAPQSFFQVNTFQAEILYSQVVKLLLEKPQSVVFDLFCGTGTIGIFVAKYVEKVIGIEINEEAVRSALRNAELNGVQNIDFVCGDAHKIAGELEESPSTIIVDPPRPGLSQELIETVCEFSPERVIYVSCNPATLARDCEIFEESSYRVCKIVPVDMFPHTYHIETIVLLEKE